MRETSSPADNTAVPIYVSTRILERLFVSTIMLLSAFISIVWAIRVPMFMMPDEVAHADYAFAIFDANHIFRLNRSRPTNFVEPETKYLIDASRYRELRYNVNATAKVDFSNHILRRKIDKRAPSPSGRSPADGATVPYVMAAYPPLYYLVVASTMSLAWNFSNHSLIASFYAGRLLNVMYLLVTLSVIYRILILSHKRLLIRVLLFSAISLLPMTDWISGYIQPDNQTAMFSVLCIYFCMLLKKDGAAASNLILLGGSESMLALTKPHYAAILAFGAFFALWNITLRKSTAGFFQLLFVTLILPCAIIFASLLTLPAGNFQGPQMDQALDNNLLTHFTQSFEKVLRTISDVYFGGAAFQSFWLHFGIRGESAFSNLPWFQSFILICLAVTTTFTIASGIQKQIGLTRRIYNVARIKGKRVALRFVANDVHLNVVVMLTVVLILLSTAANGLLVLQGRYWYPILISVYLIGVQHFSFSLRGSYRSRLTLIASVSLAMFSLIASPSAVAALNRAYYMQTSVTPKAALGDISSIVVDNTNVSGDTINLTANSELVVSGDAINTETGRSAQDVRYWIDDRGPLPARTGLKSERLANIFLDPMLANAGFTITIKSKPLSKGFHVITIRCIESQESKGLELSRLVLSVR